jgi:hypothetical protein
MAEKPSRTWLWMSCALLASLMIAALVLRALGAGHRGTILGLQLTARWSYCFFLPAYAGGALATVFGPLFQPLARRARSLGLAFASAHLTHFALVIWIYHISARPPLSNGLAAFFGTALLLTYLLALFSIPTLAARLPARAWWALRNFGMDFIALAFLRDFLQDPFNRSMAHVVGYLPFAALGLVAVAVRIVAYIKRLRHRWLAPQAAA